MKKPQIKRVLYSALAAVLRREVMVDGNPSDAELNRFWEVQEKMAAEFERRSKGEKLSREWDSK